MNKTIKPEFIRLPRSGAACPHCGLSRATLNGLIHGESPKVASAVLKSEGATRGIRLVHYESLMEYLYSQSNVCDVTI